MPDEMKEQCILGWGQGPVLLCQTSNRHLKLRSLRDTWQLLVWFSTCLFFFFFLAATYSMWDLGSLTKD